MKEKRNCSDHVRSIAGNNRQGKGARAFQAPVAQFKVELTDSDAGIYQETEDGKFASDLGELHFTGYYQGKGRDNPIFIRKQFVDAMWDEYDRIEGDDQVNNKAGAKEYTLIKESAAAKFYTETADVTNAVGQLKAHYVKMAMGGPLIKDPNRARGLQHRYADPDGVMFSRFTKQAVEEQLGYQLPQTVTFYQVKEEDWNAQVELHKNFWTEVSASFAYGRHADKRAIVPRSRTSKFRHGRLSSTDANDFSGNDYAANLPAAQPAAFDSGWIDHKAYVNPKDRGDGQFKAMKNWNALAYAAYWYHHGHNDKVNIGQDWEWLHIRGAQNGGETTIQNLVAGTSTTNSRMIPWEDKINSWTNVADRNHPLSVKYLAARVDNTNLGKSIEIQVAAENGLPGVVGAVPKGSPMSLKFNPLDGTAYDKLSNRLTEKRVVNEAFQDTRNRNVEAEKQVRRDANRDYIDQHQGQLLRFVVIGSHPYKGLYVEMRTGDGQRGYYRNMGNVIVEALNKSAAIDLGNLRVRDL